MCRVALLIPLVILVALCSESISTAFGASTEVELLNSSSCVSAFRAFAVTQSPESRRFEAALLEYDRLKPNIRADRKKIEELTEPLVQLASEHLKTLGIKHRLIREKSEIYIELVPSDSSAFNRYIRGLGKLHPNLKVIYRPKELALENDMGSFSTDGVLLLSHKSLLNASAKDPTLRHEQWHMYVSRNLSRGRISWQNIEVEAKEASDSPIRKYRVAGGPGQYSDYFAMDEILAYQISVRDSVDALLDAFARGDTSLIRHRLSDLKFDLFTSEEANRRGKDFSKTVQAALDQFSAGKKDPAKSIPWDRNSKPIELNIDGTSYEVRLRGRHSQSFDEDRHIPTDSLNFRIEEKGTAKTKQTAFTSSIPVRLGTEAVGKSGDEPQIVSSLLSQLRDAAEKGQKKVDQIRGTLGAFLKERNPEKRKELADELRRKSRFQATRGEI